MPSTVTIIGCGAARTRPKKLTVILKGWHGFWDEQTVFPGFRHSCSQAGLSKNDNMTEMFTVISESDVDSSDYQGAAIAYESTEPAKDTVLSLPEFFRQTPTNSMAETKFSLLEADEVWVHPDLSTVEDPKTRTFRLIRDAMTRKGLEVTEDTPISLVLHSPTASDTTGMHTRWVIFSWWKEGYSADCDGDVGDIQ